ncbi:MAG: hypothetical protein RMJ39_09555, partial [Deltaproteobacteria bacterium]|nr:hypothetical protein [Deltaproteobacteria bacterium]
MKVNDRNIISLIDSIFRTPDVKRQTGHRGVGSENLEDRVELLRQKVFDDLKKRALEGPEVRQEKVLETKALIETKTYNMKGEIVAKAILR